MQVVRYTPKQADLWNAFVQTSRNATFLLLRQYMDYHSSRFTDHSLLFINDKGELCGLLPANTDLAAKAVWSHQGLTYGGLLLRPKTSYSAAAEMLDLAHIYYKGIGLETFIYKPIPHIYASYPSEEDLYWLFRNKAVLRSRAISSCIDLSTPLPLSTLRHRKAKKAQREGVSVSPSTDWEGFWTILTDVLSNRHGVRPVHSLDEIKLLHSRFPNDIRLFTTQQGATLLGGCVVYHTHNVAHIQYIAANKAGFALGALDLLFHTLTESTKARGTRYLDFGISTENGGQVLNDGLLFQKEGLGGRAVVYDSYELSL